MSKATVQNKPEAIGRKYETIRFLVHSRRVKSEDGFWYGSPSGYETEQEAKEAIAQMGNALFTVGGGLTLDTGKPSEPYEYRIVKRVSQCEVVHLETRKI